MKRTNTHNFAEAEAADDAIAKIRQLAPPQESFLGSILRTYEKYRTLTVRQLETAERAIDEAERHDATTRLTSIGYQEYGRSLIRLLDDVSTGIRYPKIWLTLADGSRLLVSRSGRKSREPGQIRISDGGPWGENALYGYIHRTGYVSQTARMTSEMLAALVDLAEDLEATAAHEGRLSGRCCFCRSELTTPASVAHGYGPVCAGRYGLPWSTKKKKSGSLWG